MTLWPYRKFVVREEVVILKNQPTGGEANCVVSDSSQLAPERYVLSRHRLMSVDRKRLPWSDRGAVVSFLPLRGTAMRYVYVQYNEYYLFCDCLVESANLPS